MYDLLNLKIKLKQIFNLEWKYLNSILESRRFQFHNFLQGLIYVDFNEEENLKFVSSD